jgi:hypothetical protein
MELPSGKEELQHHKKNNMADDDEAPPAKAEKGGAVTDSRVEDEQPNPRVNKDDGTQPVAYLPGSPFRIKELATTTITTTFILVVLICSSSSKMKNRPRSPSLITLPF